MKIQEIQKKGEVDELSAQWKGKGTQVEVTNNLSKWSGFHYPKKGHKELPGKNRFLKHAEFMAYL